MTAGNLIDVAIDAIAYTGKRVARPGEKILFLDRGVPGETVRARVTRVQKRFLEGQVVAVLQSSPDRIEPPCPYYGTCGGCHFQEIHYEQQLHWKLKTVEDTLQRLGGFKDLHISAPVAASPRPFNYRNKVALHFGGEGEKRGLGFYHRQSNKMVRIEACLLLQNRLNSILAKSIEFFSRMAPEKRALFTRLHIRSGDLGGSCLFYTKPGSRQDIKKILRQFARISGQQAGFTVDRHRPPGAGEVTAVRGDGTTVHRAGPYRFRAGMTSFVQVNPWINRKLLHVMRDMMAGAKPGLCVDAYAGSGHLGLFLSSRFDEIVALEAHEPSVQDAIENFRFNRIKNVRIHHARIGEWAGTPLRLAAPPDVLLLDPPRSGCSARAVDFLSNLGAERVFYISCDPATLARDLKAFCRSSAYTIEKVLVFDMFPQTYHVEIVTALRAK
jgi:23S rRNA (uracil1939-C5)-methyltransferase